MGIIDDKYLMIFVYEIFELFHAYVESWFLTLTWGGN